VSEHRPLVTIAALYGTGVSVIGPRVAERLGVPYLDREVRGAIGRESRLSEDVIADIDDEPHTRLARLFTSLGRASTPATAGTAPGDRRELQERRLRGRIEEALAHARDSGGVAIGRGGMVVLHDVRWALHVHLGGPRRSRIDQAMALDGIDRATAERRQALEDRARRAYVRHAYGVDAGDAEHYHLMLDSTAVELDACVEVIVSLSAARLRSPGETEST
jgi:hypothetical protein